MPATHKRPPLHRLPGAHWLCFSNRKTAPIPHKPFLKRNLPQIRLAANWVRLMRPGPGPPGQQFRAFPRIAPVGTCHFQRPRKNLRVAKADLLFSASHLESHILCSVHIVQSGSRPSRKITALPCDRPAPAGRESVPSFRKPSQNLRGPVEPSRLQQSPPGTAAGLGRLRACKRGTRRRDPVLLRHRQGRQLRCVNEALR